MAFTQCIHGNRTTPGFQELARNTPRMESYRSHAFCETCPKDNAASPHVCGTCRGSRGASLVLISCCARWTALGSHRCKKVSSSFWVTTLWNAFSVAKYTRVFFPLAMSCWMLLRVPLLLPSQSM